MRNKPPSSSAGSNLLPPEQTGSRKSELRRYFRALRNSVSAATRTRSARAIARSVLTSSLPLAADRIGVFMSADGEPDIEPTIEKLWQLRKTICLPVIRKLSGKLEFYRFEPRAVLIEGEFGIPVPPADALHLPLLSLDLLFVPLVAFDDRGTRLGMGGGYYDRTLASLPASLRPVLIGIAHACQKSDRPLPRSAHDIALDGVITEAGLQTFRRNRF